MRMFPLQRYFSIASFIALGLVTAVLFYFNRQIALEQVVAMGERGNVALAQLFANSLWPRFSPYVKSVSGLSGDALRERSETSLIFQASSRLAKDLPVLKLKIYDLSGLTVFSSEPNQIGEDKSDNVGYMSVASGGGPASKLSQRGKFSAFSGVMSDVALVETYVPVRNDEGQLEGVFELYSDVTPMVQRIDQAQFQLSLVFVFLFLVLYAILFLIVHHANTILRSQYLEIHESRKILGLKNYALEELLTSRPPESADQKALEREALEGISLWINDDRRTT